MPTKNDKKVQTEPALKTPLLRLLLRYFGYLSVQLYPVGMKHFTGNFVWNLVLVGSFVYEIFTRQGDYYRSRSNNMDIMAVFLKKPLYRVLISSIMRNLFPISYSLRVLYFVVISFQKSNSSSLIHLLDQLSITGNFNDDKKVQKRTSSKTLFIFVCVVLFQQLLIFLTIFQALISMSKMFSPFGSFMQFITLLTLHQNHNMSYMLAIYCKYATLKSLKEIVRRFKVSGNIAALQLQLARLATLNMKLHRLLSFPYLFSLVPYIIQALIALTCTVMDHPRDTDTFALNFLVYTAVVVGLGSAIERQLSELHNLIWIHLKVRQQRLMRLFKYSQAFSSASFSSDRRQQCLKWIELVPLYEKCFQLKIYNFFTINWRFVLLLGIFLCNLVVLVSQTSAII